MRLYPIIANYRGLSMQFAQYQAECEGRPFSWTDTRTVCTFKCRCSIHETASATKGA